VSELAVVAGLSLGLGLAVAAWQARVAFLAWLAFRRETDKPAPQETPSSVVERLQAVETELSRQKVERLTGRR